MKYQRPPLGLHKSEQYPRHSALTDALTDEWGRHGVAARSEHPFAWRVKTRGAGAR